MKEKDAARTDPKDAVFTVRYLDALRNRRDNSIPTNSQLIRLQRGRPNNLFHEGIHFEDAPSYRNTCSEKCPMDYMYNMVKEANLQRTDPVDKTNWIHYLLYSYNFIFILILFEHSISIYNLF